jgi:rubrerythrin
MKRFADLREQEVLALAISNEDEDNLIYRSFADWLRRSYPDTAGMFDKMAEEEIEHRGLLLDLYRKKFGCHVAVIAPSHKHRHGSGFRVHISITVSPHENVIVNHAPSDDSRYEHVEMAVKDAFASARRQLDALSQQK